MESRLIYRNVFASTTVLSGLVVALLPAHAIGAPPQIHDLGTLGGASAFARDINESGQIVGESTTRRGESHAFLSTPWVAGGRLLDLGTLGGPSSQALGVSNRGQVTGSSSLNASGEQTRAFLWDQGRMVALPPLNGAPFSEGFDVNDAGTVVGHSGDVAVRWQNGTVRSLGDLGGGTSSATGINSSGVIVGNGSTSNFQNHGWVFKNGTMTDLGAFGGTFSTADGINSTGDIVGRFETSTGAIHGYILKNGGVFTDLGGLVSFSGARAISDSGLIVGEGGGESFLHGVLWDYNRVLTDLGALRGSTFSSAFSVNSGGAIVGVSFLDGNARAVLWR